MNIIRHSKKNMFFFFNVQPEEKEEKKYFYYLENIEFLRLSLNYICTFKHEIKASKYLFLFNICLTVECYCLLS